MKIKLRLFLTLLVCLLLAIPAVMAPSHPVFIDPETGQTIDEILGDPGTTPDSTWYVIDRWWESIQLTNADTPEEEAELLEHLTQERYAELHAMIEEGNDDAAESAVEETREIFEQTVETVEEIEATGENIGLLHDFVQAALTQE